MIHMIFTSNLEKFKAFFLNNSTLNFDFDGLMQMTIVIKIYIHRLICLMLKFENVGSFWDIFTLYFQEDQIQYEFFSTYDACFYVRLMQEIQNYGLEWNLMTVFELHAK